MGKPAIYITRKVPEDLLSKYENQFSIKMWEKEDERVPRGILLKEAESVDGLLTVLSDQIDEDLLTNAANLKVVANLAVGYDNIDLSAADKHGVVITNTPDVLSETTADLGFALLMATARRIVEANEFVKKDKWKEWAPYLLAGTDIHHQTIGILGMGRIGEAIARRAAGFNMNIRYHNRSRKMEAEKNLGAVYSSFEDLLTESDFIVSVVPLTEETANIFNKKAFEMMKSSAIFINISRGAVVDEAALLEALKSGEIKGAGLDVFREEPAGSENPLVGLQNVVCLPHIGSASVDTRTTMIKLCLENINGVISGNGAKTPVK
ncbi:2-hydroxyacid dehydrogenase [Oceanobacillus massiliensis]|uniref:2-hydroxyacid dehydrogenase n=1 Tax=Oceanobacillus massiliensis TaxID=1465765 RepID=UPI0002891F62|nr:D-glycerate dehydrogenase [Oceanobacillus massiliensis]